MPWGFTTLPQPFNSDSLAASLVCSRAQSTNVALGRGTNPTMYGTGSQTYFCVPYPNDQNVLRNNQLRHPSQAAPRETNHRTNSLFERSDCMRSLASGYPFNSVHNHARAVPASEPWCVNERRPDCVWLQPTPKRRRTSSGSLGSSNRNSAPNRRTVGSISSGLPVQAMPMGLSSLSGMPNLTRISNLRTIHNPNLNITYPDPHSTAASRHHDWFYRCPPTDSESVHWHNELRQVSNLVSVAAAAAAAAAAVSQTNAHRSGSYDSTVNMTNPPYSSHPNYGHQTVRNQRQHPNRSMPTKFHQRRFFVATPKKRQLAGLSMNQRPSHTSSSGGSNACSPSSSSCSRTGLTADQSKSGHSSPGSSWSLDGSPNSQADGLLLNPAGSVISGTEVLNSDTLASDKYPRQVADQISGSSSSSCGISSLTSTDSNMPDSRTLIPNEPNPNQLSMPSDLVQCRRVHQFDCYHPCPNSRDQSNSENVETVGDFLQLAYAACTVAENPIASTVPIPTTQQPASIQILESIHQSGSVPENSNPTSTDSSNQLTRLSLNHLTANLVSGSQDSQSEEATVVAAAVVASAAAHAVAAAAQAVSAAVNQRRTSDTSVFQPLPPISTTHPFIVPVTPTSRNNNSPTESFAVQPNGCLSMEPPTHSVLPDFTNNDSSGTQLDPEQAQLLSNQILANLAVEQNLHSLDLELGSSTSSMPYPISNGNFTNRPSCPVTLSCSGYIGSQHSLVTGQSPMPSDCQPTSGARFVHLSPTLTIRNCLRPVVVSDNIPNRSNPLLTTLPTISPMGATDTDQQMPTFTYAAQSNFVTVPTEVAAAAAAVAAVAAAANCSTTANNVSYPTVAQRTLNISAPIQQCPASSLFTPCLPPLSSFTPIPLLSVRSPQSPLIGQASMSNTRDVNTLFQFLRLINQRQDSYTLPYYPSAMTATARGSNQSVVVSAPGGVANGSRVASAVTPPLHPHHPTLPHNVNTTGPCTMPTLPPNHLINRSNLIFDNQTVPGQTGSQPTSSTAVALAAVAMAAAALQQQQQTTRHASSNTISMLSVPRAAPTPSIPVPILHAHLYYPRTVATMQQMQDSAHQQCYHNHYGGQHQHPHSQRPSSLPVVQPTVCIPSSQPNLMTAVPSNSTSPAYLAGLFPFLLTVPASPTPTENVATSNATDIPSATLFAHYPSDHSLRIPTPVSMLPRNVPDTTSAATAAAAAAAAVAAAAVSVDRLLHWAVQLESNTRRGLTKEELDSLPIHLYASKKPKGTNSGSPIDQHVKENESDSSSSSSLEQERCMICLDDYEDEQQIRKMRCRHEFHAECVDQWLQNKRTCPLCRADAFDGTQRKELFF